MGKKGLINPLSNLSLKRKIFIKALSIPINERNYINMTKV
jgi:hypothetical protein